jgi:hypothetical protein
MLKLVKRPIVSVPNLIFNMIFICVIKIIKVKYTKVDLIVTHFQGQINSTKVK